MFFPQNADFEKHICLELSAGDVRTPSYLNIAKRKLNNTSTVKLNNDTTMKVHTSYYVTFKNTHNRFLEDKVAPHKKLAGGVCFVKELPKTATGKLLRRELKRMSMEGIA